MTRSPIDDYRDLCTTVGMMALAWSWAENVLAMTLGIIDKYAGPIKGHEEALLSLKRRIRAFRAALSSIAILHPLQQEGSQLADRFIRLGRGRHNFMHGAAIKLHEGIFEGVLVGVDGGKYTVKPHRFDVSDARSLEAQIAELSRDATDFMLTVCGVFERR